MMVHLNWKSPTGHTGKGKSITKTEANAWVSYLSGKYPNWTHWISDI